MQGLGFKPRPPPKKKPSIYTLNVKMFMIYLFSDSKLGHHQLPKFLSLDNAWPVRMLLRMSRISRPPLVGWKPVQKPKKKLSLESENLVRCKGFVRITEYKSEPSILSSGVFLWSTVRDLIGPSSRIHHFGGLNVFNFCKKSI
jgi:hypothetical protein